MIGKTYIELVNESIFESNVTLDPLTYDNFDNPPRTIMYTRFKKWINDAYVELLEDRKDWRFRVGRTSLHVFPRLLLSNVVTFPAVGDVLVGRTSGVRVRVEQVHSFEYYEGNPVTTATISVSYLPTSGMATLVFDEIIDKLEPTVETEVATLQGLGYYDFKSEIPYLEDILPDSVYAHPVPDATDDNPNFYGKGMVGSKVVYTINRGRDLFYPAGTKSIPYSMAKASTNFWQLYPQPGGEMILEFEFTKEINRMVSAYDVPFAIPDLYHDYLIWRAVAEYADFQRDSAVWSRAKKHLDKFEYYLFRDQLKDPSFVECAFTGG